MLEVYFMPQHSDNHDKVMINCKLHRLLLRSKVFGSVRSDIFTMGKRKFEIDQIVQSTL